MAELPFLAFDADHHYYEALDAFTRYIEPGFSDEEIRRVMRDNALALARRRPATAA